MTVAPDRIEVRFRGGAGGRGLRLFALAQALDERLRALRDARREGGEVVEEMREALAPVVELRAIALPGAAPRSRCPRCSPTRGRRPSSGSWNSSRPHSITLSGPKGIPEGANRSTVRHLSRRRRAGGSGEIGPVLPPLVEGVPAGAVPAFCHPGARNSGRVTYEANKSSRH